MKILWRNRCTVRLTRRSEATERQVAARSRARWCAAWPEAHALGGEHPYNNRAEPSLAPDSTEHFGRYLDEYVFRLNRRTSTHRGLLFHRVLEQAVRAPPASYEDIVAG